MGYLAPASVYISFLHSLNLVLLLATSILLLSVPVSRRSSRVSSPLSLLGPYYCCILSGSAVSTNVSASLPLLWQTTVLPSATPNALLFSPLV